MCKNNNNNFYFALPCIILIVSGMAFFFLTCREILEKSNFNLKISILALSLIFTLLVSLSVISMVATYREISRRHYMSEKNKIEDLKKRVEKLEKCCEEQKKQEKNPQK